MLVMSYLLSGIYIYKMFTLINPCTIFEMSYMCTFVMYLHYKRPVAITLGQPNDRSPGGD